MKHLAFAVADEERSRRFYEPDYLSVKCLDPDGYVVQVIWEAGTPA